VAVSGRADIVTRLRDWASTICMVRGDDAPGSKARLALEAAELIETLRKVNDEVFATGIKSVRDVAELAIELRDARRERDEARRSCCEFAAIVDGADTTDGIESGRFREIAMKYMKERGWDCFPASEERVRDSYENGGAP
jgi:hypothetical protein